LTHPGLKPLERVLVTMPTSVTAVLWFGAGLWSRAPGERGLELADTSVGGALIGIGLVLVATLAGRPRLSRWMMAAPWLAVTAMTAILALEYRSQPELLLESVGATARNLAGEGMWGVSWIVLGVLGAGALFSDGFENDRFFVIPIAGFGVMFWLLIYLREGSYRVGGRFGEPDPGAHLPGDRRLCRHRSRKQRSNRSDRRRVRQCPPSASRSSAVNSSGSVRNESWPLSE
jgi:hypothetical protein